MSAVAALAGQEGASRSGRGSQGRTTTTHSKSTSISTASSWSRANERVSFFASSSPSTSSSTPTWSSSPSSTSTSPSEIYGGWTLHRDWASAKGGMKLRGNRQRSTMRSSEKPMRMNGYQGRHRRRDRRASLMGLGATISASAPIRFSSSTLRRRKEPPLLRLVDFGACRRTSPCEARSTKQRD